MAPDVSALRLAWILRFIAFLHSGNITITLLNKFFRWPWDKYFQYIDCKISAQQTLRFSLYLHLYRVTKWFAFLIMALKRLWSATVNMVSQASRNTTVILKRLLMCQCKRETCKHVQQLALVIKHVWERRGGWRYFDLTVDSISPLVLLVKRLSVNMSGSKTLVTQYVTNG